MIRALFALAALVVLVGPVRAADDPPGPKINWPDVKGTERKEPKTYDDKRFGYSVQYQSDKAFFTVFVYNAGVEKIPDGPESDTVKAEMYESLLVLEAQKRGKQPRYKSLSPLDEEVIDFGASKTAPQIRRKRYEVEIIGEGAAVTELYLTGYKNHFIKIRATYPTEDKDKYQKLLANLLDALGKELK
jgi:hypothetical protein